MSAIPPPEDGGRPNPEPNKAAIKAANLASLEVALENEARRTLAELDSKKSLPGWHTLPSFGQNVMRVGPITIPKMTDDQAAALVKLAETDPHAFDAASYVAGLHVTALHLTGGRGFPAPLRIFAARVLRDELRRPERPGRSKGNPIWPVRLLVLCHAAALSGIPLTGGRERKGPGTVTACAMVAEAFTRAGRHVDESYLAKLCHHPGYAEIRALAEALFRGSDTDTAGEG
jgi:hypothetical protein